MIKTTCINYLMFALVLLFSVNSSAQELLDIGEKSASDSQKMTSLRSENAISFGAGSLIVKDDSEIFIELNLKRFITPNLAVSLNLKKFDIENFDFDENGFLSGDLNVEWYLFPQKKLTPYFYAGPGILLSNDFKDKNFKVQGGLGLDFLITNCIGIVGSLEANYIYDEQNDSQLLQVADGLYYNASVGVQYYFGNGNNSKTKLPKENKTTEENTKKQQSTIIESNWIGRTRL